MKLKKKVFSHVINVLTVALIIGCFLCAMMQVGKLAREDCFERIEDTTVQVSETFVHTIEEKERQLMLFAGILAANSSNPDDLLQKYMEHFCTTQSFQAVCIHRKDDTFASYGLHPHEQVALQSFESEIKRVPYISTDFVSTGAPEDSMIYMAVPVVRELEQIAVLYGYITLDQFPNFYASNDVYNGANFYIVDGDTGIFLMDEYHGTLVNAFDGSLSNRETRTGYDLKTMEADIKTGQNGYYIFRSQKTGEWYYTYYMPMGINNWSMQTTIDEPTAFSVYDDIRLTMVILMIVVIVLMFIHVVVLMTQNIWIRRRDKASLHKADYVNAVQSALISAHSVPDFTSQALRLVAEEMEAETALLFLLKERTVSNVQFWPSKDKSQAQSVLGANVQEMFPALYDLLSAKESICYDGVNSGLDLPEDTKAFFDGLNIANLMLVPIMDNNNVMRGVLVAVNVRDTGRGMEMLECVSNDFFMAISNLENHNIIKNMAAMDYLTGLKNRNSYEMAIEEYRDLQGEQLWCIFVDVNGLHEINNTKGHKFGDEMLCAVAGVIRRTFGHQDAYRVGGDEFVVFAKKGSDTEYEEKKTRIKRELEARGYYVSVGFAGVEKGQSGTFDIGKVIEDAENSMYRDKKEYYRNNRLSEQRKRSDFDSEEEKMCGQEGSQT